MNTLTIPEFALVVLIGASGAGKSTFARKHFLPTEVISSDVCRGLVSDDENDQSATKDAFELVHFLAGKRLEKRRLSVIDATNVRPEDRKSLVALARRYYTQLVAIVLNPGQSVCHERNQHRPDRQFGAHVVQNQYQQLMRGINDLDREGFRCIYELRSVEVINEAVIVRQRLPTDGRDLHGPFDIMGDVHGCFDELWQLLGKLGYRMGEDQQGFYAHHPQDRRLAFVGDLVDRGPKVVEVLQLVMRMVKDGTALCVLGNHEAKLLKWLQGRNVKLTHGLQASVTQLQQCSESFRLEVHQFLESLPSHYWLDEGKLVVVHAGIKPGMIGRASNALKAFCIYGETTGETDEFGLPIRYPWAMDYRGNTYIVYGHTPALQAGWLNHTICLDTGCVFGGKLSALHYPEMELVSVDALQVYCEPSRPLGLPSGLPTFHSTPTP